MAVPVLRQTTPVVTAQATGSAQTLTFPSGILVDSTIVFCGFGGRPDAPTMAANTASVTMTGAAMQRRAEVFIPGGSFGCTVWTADKVTTAGATAMTYTPGGADSYVGLVAFELTSNATSGSSWEGFVTNAQDSVNSLVLGPLPSSGSMSQADTMSIYVTGANQGGAGSDIGWTVPSGWTSIASQGDPTGAKKPFAVAYKTATSTNAVSVTTNSAQADVNGRAGILFAIRGNVGSSPAPTPPPPGPAPAPPPPAPAQAVKVSGVQKEAAGLTGIKVQVHGLPSTAPILGDLIFSATNAAFSMSLESGDAVMYIAVPIPLPGGGTLATGADVIVIGQKADGTGAFRGGVSGTVVEV